MRAIPFPERAVLQVTGGDSTKFLQGIVTNSVDTLTSGQATYAALLTPQGKIIVDFLIAAVEPEEGGGFIIDAPKALAGELAAKLNLYKLRAKVEIAARPDLAVAVVLDKEPPQELGLVFLDPRHAGLGWRVVLPAEGAEAALTTAGMTMTDMATWQGRRISIAIPEGGKDFVYGDTFPHEADMDAIGGVDFSKGCFIGQEVVSRVERRDIARKRVVPVAFEYSAPEPGAEVKAGDTPVGYMGSAAGRLGLAMLRLDRVDAALKEGGKVMSGGVELTLIKPDWADFRFPGEAEVTA